MRLPEGMQRAIKVSKDLICKEWKWQNNERVILNRADGAYSLWIDEDLACIYKIGDSFPTKPIDFGSVGEFIVYLAFAYRVNKDEKLQYTPTQVIDDTHQKFMEIE